MCTTWGKSSLDFPRARPAFPAVIRPPDPAAVAPVSDAVVEVAPAVTAPVTDLLQDSPASRLTDPDVETARSVPVVGDLLDELSVPDALAETTAQLFLDAQRVEASVDALVSNTTDDPGAPVPAAHAPPAAPASAAPVGGGGGVVTDAADTFAASSTTRSLPGGRGPTDDDLPSAPVFETDASPD